MAFPATTPTSQPQASALLSNNAANAGLTNATPFDRLTNIEQVLANLLTDLPAGINVAALTTAISTSSTIKSTGPTAGVGYATGAGGTVTQATSKSTGVTLSKVCGQITLNNANLAATTSVAFTLTNTAIAATDVVLVNFASANTANSYFVSVDAVAAGSCSISLRNYTAGGLAEAVVLNFVVIKGVSA